MEDFLNFLRSVEHPSRYIGFEKNRAQKDLSKVKLRGCLVFPDLYEIGNSHLGFELVYWLFNQHPDVYCERAFAPAPDAIAALRTRNIKLFSLETKTPLDEFDFIGISLLYSMHFATVVEILRLSGLSIRSKDRKGMPIIIAGGIECINPEPMADFIDVFAIGDGEILVPKIVEIMLDAKEKAIRREEILEIFANSEFFYVPVFADKGKQKLPIKRAILPDLESAVCRLDSIVPLSQVVHDRLVIEIARGCFRNCRFCQAGYFYRPVRERSVNKILREAQNLIKKTGYDEISLLSLSAGDHSQIELILETLIKSFSHIPVAVSLPSLQVKTLTPEIASAIASVKKSGFTIAPEAGTERLRNVLNKPITDSEMFDAIRAVFEQGWDLVKLYFMVGLPTETEDDRKAIVELVSSLAKISSGHKRIRLNVNIGTFVPKPHTAFQWARQFNLSESIQVLENFKKIFGGRVQLKWHDPKMSYVEGILSRSGREGARLIENVWKKGAILDGWGDYFKFEIWEKAIEEEQIDVERIFDEKALKKEFSWEIIDIGVKREYFESEWKASLNASLTPTCKELCTDCGVCAGEITLVFAKPREKAVQKASRETINLNIRYRIKLAKLGLASLLSHHEIYEILSRAFLRAGAYLAYSEGFHPKPKFSFGLPTKVGVESEEEFIDVWLKNFIKPNVLVKRLQNELPEGLFILDAKIIPEDVPTLASSLVGACYEVDLSAVNGLTEEKIEKAMEKFSSFKLAATKKIRRLKDRTFELEIIGPLVSLPPPDKIVAEIFEIDDLKMKGIRMKKLRTYLGYMGEESGGVIDKRNA